MNNKQREYARKVIKAHYQLKRQPTNAEIDAEIKNLQRKTHFGALCDIAMLLKSKLSVGRYPINTDIVWEK